MEGRKVTSNICHEIHWEIQIASPIWSPVSGRGSNDTNNMFRLAQRNRCG